MSNGAESMCEDSSGGAPEAPQVNPLQDHQKVAFNPASTENVGFGRTTFTLIESSEYSGVAGCIR